MLRLGVRMRVRAASTAERTAVETRVKEPSAWPSRLAATESASLRTNIGNATHGEHDYLKRGETWADTQLEGGVLLVCAAQCVGRRAVCNCHRGHTALRPTLQGTFLA